MRNLYAHLFMRNARAWCISPLLSGRDPVRFTYKTAKRLADVCSARDHNHRKVIFVGRRSVDIRPFMPVW
jgi:hypothetical protein